MAKSWLVVVRAPVLLCFLSVCLTSLHAVGSAADEIRIDHGLGCDALEPDIAPLPGGGFVVAWGGRDVAARLLGAGGDPLGEDFKVSLGTEGLQDLAAVAADTEGRFLVVWLDRHLGLLLGRAFDASGRPLGEELLLAEAQPASIAVAAAPDGSFVVAWEDPSTGLEVRRFDLAGSVLASFGISNEPGILQQRPSVAVDATSNLWLGWREWHGGFPFPWSVLRLRRFDPGGAPLGEPLLELTEGALATLSIATDATGLFAAWSSQLDGGSIFARRFGPAGAPLGEPVRVSSADRIATAPDVAALGDGRFAVVWEAFDARTLGPLSPPPDVFGRLIGISGSPLSPEIRVNDSLEDSQRSPRLAVTRGGQIVTVWWTEEPLPPFLPPDCSRSGGVFGRLFRPACADGGVCLADGRFQVQVEWLDTLRHRTRTAAAVPITRDTGAFWFFDRDNLELVTKMIDGRTVNGHYWFFYGALSNVGYQIHVKDLESGEERTYDNPQGLLASFADTAAFPVAGNATAPTRGLESGLRATNLLTTLASPSHRPEDAGGAGPCTDPRLPVIVRPGLCLTGTGRPFEVEIAWHDPWGGGSGLGHGVSLTTDTGAFWFFDPDNLELMVKVLDGRLVNGHYWVFFGALSNVEYTLVVRDAETGREVVYENPAFRFRSLADTAAFPAEPEIP